ncbi:MAG: AAA family ATPase [Actinomycetales bacterium]
MPSPVLVQKLSEPDPAGLARPRLLQRLADADAMGLVVAPAGAGKTTLLAHAARATTSPVAWYTLAPEDATEQSFVAHLGASIARALGETAWETETLDGLLLEWQDLGDTRDGLTCLVVLDDVHEISGLAAESALARLVRLRPAGMRLLIGSRRVPALALTRLIAGGTVLHIDEDDLRFRSWEVEQLYRSVYDEPLSPESVAALARRTGGWAAGLQLFHLSTQGKRQVDRERAVHQLTGRSRLIRSYLTENLVDELPPQRRDFLVRTVTLGVLRGDLCDDLLATQGSGSVLAELERGGFFTTSTDDGATYRYHRVLASHLEVLLVELHGDGRARELYARSAELLEQSGFLEAALRAYARADRWPDVARLTRLSASQVALDERLDHRRIPVLAQDPWVALSSARRSARNGRLTAAVAGYTEAESLADDESFARVCRHERSLCELWLPGASISAVHRPTPIQLLRQAMIALPTVQSAPALPPLVSAAVHLLAGRPESATRVVAETVGQNSAPGWQSLGRAVIAAALDAIGPEGLDDGMRALEEVAATADQAGYGWLAHLATGLQTCVLATAGSEFFDVAEQLVIARLRDDDPWGASILGLLVTAAMAAAGESEAVQALMAELNPALAATDSPVLLSWAGGIAAVGRGEAPDPTSADALQARRLGITGYSDALARLTPGSRTVPAPAISSSALTCLGAFCVQVDGSGVDLGPLRPRARTLLMLLAIRHGHDVHRDLLIETLWPGTPVDKGAHRLHVAASSVRRLLAAAGCGEQVLVRTGDAYRLQLDGCDVDVVEELARRIGAARARGSSAEVVDTGLELLSHYAGDLVPEAGTAEWIVGERDRLRFLASSAALEAADAAVSVGRLADALRAAQRCVGIDPLRDSGWRLLAQIQERLGEPSAAVVTRREHQRVVAELT